ncbi:MAG: Tat pathway signal protein, partial [Asticcacaulis sp.]|nr:Tat pathway signal protein [Asticcacaulis sp.]
MKTLAPQTLTDDIQYSFPPYAPRLKLLFESGKLAAQLNVGPLITPLTLEQYKSSNRALYPLPPKLFSHNDQQSVWQALGSEGSTIGWGGRMGDLAMAGNGNALLTCISAAGNAVFVSGENALQYQISPSGAIAVKAIQGLPYGSPAISEALHQLITRPSEHKLENELAILARRSIKMEGVVNTALAKVDIKTSFDQLSGPNPLADQLKIVARL